MRISVVIPVFNGEKHIESCLKSVRAQTFPDFECLCVDNGST
ncbi:MAG TPA: glycosyl transferase, partial [Alphaproteobacteria bacterium]|nr:glycosyl transferase [Alphaproteobacteria bacterium]